MIKPGIYETVRGEQYRLETGAKGIIVFIYRGFRMQVKSAVFKVTPIRHLILAIETQIEANRLKTEEQ